LTDVAVAGSAEGATAAMVAACTGVAKQAETPRSIAERFSLKVDGALPSLKAELQSVGALAKIAQQAGECARSLRCVIFITYEAFNLIVTVSRPAAAG
jgi:hypothetical protein